MPNYSRDVIQNAIRTVALTGREILLTVDNPTDVASLRVRCYQARHYIKENKDKFIESKVDISQETDEGVNGIILKKADTPVVFRENSNGKLTPYYVADIDSIIRRVNLMKQDNISLEEAMEMFTEVEREIVPILWEEEENEINTKTETI